MKRPLLLVLTLAAGLLVGCGTARIPLDPMERARLKSHPVIQTVRYDPPARFGLVATEPMHQGLAGLIEDAISGDDRHKAKDARTIRIEDPAVVVQEQLVAAVTAELALANLRPAAPQPSDEPARLRAALGPGYALDFKTEVWTFVYYPTDWHHYRVVYRARSRLVRLADEQVLWQGTCFFRNDDPSTSPTMDQLAANDGAVLKSKSDEAGKACAQQMAAQFFGRAGAAESE